MEGAVDTIVQSPKKKEVVSPYNHKQVSGMERERESSRWEERY